MLDLVFWSVRKDRQRGDPIASPVEMHHSIEASYYFATTNLRGFPEWHCQRSDFPQLNKHLQ